MTTDRPVERRGSQEKGYISMIKDILSGKIGPESPHKLIGTAYGRTGVRWLGFSPEDYWNVGAIRTTFVDVGDELADVREQVDNLSSSMKSLKSEVLSCKDCINRISEELSERPIVKETWLLDVDEDIEVLQAIPIVIEETEDEVVASFPEVEVFAVGAGEAEAINDLKGEIRKLYYELIDKPDEQLGRVPQSWKRVLAKVMRKVGKTERI